MMRRKADRIALGLCLYFIALAVLYAAVTPPFEAPDEASHFLYIHNFLKTGQLPILEDRATVFKSQSVQRHHPPLYYLIGAGLVSWTQRGAVDAYLQQNPLASIGMVTDNNLNVYLHPVPPPPGDTIIAIWVLRLYSIALGAATVWLIYKSVYLVTNDARPSLLTALLVISIPSFVHISASINNDNLVTLLHAAGVFCCLRMWARRIAPADIAAVSLILGAVALTKVNGLTLFGVVYGWIVLGVLLRRFNWRNGIALVGVSVLAAGLIAGWWYIRNQQLYGDPLGLTATLRIWGRGGAPHVMDAFEAKGVWDSFWFTLGHFNILGPDWLYKLYLPAVTILALVGILIAAWRDKTRRWYLLFLSSVGTLAIVSLLVATSRINVSQGRILFPGMVAFAALFVIGWYKLLGRGAGLIVLPLTALAVITPIVYLAPAYAHADIVEGLPANAQAVNVKAGTLHLVGYQMLTDTAQPDGWMRLNLYMRSPNADNPYLFVKAINPLTGDVLGGVDEYPGMTPPETWHGDALYAVPVRFRLDDSALNRGVSPYQMQLVVGWRVPDGDHPGQGKRIALTDAAGLPIENLLLGGATWVSPNPAPLPATLTDVVYGGSIRLSGYTLSTQRAVPGGSLKIMLDWGYAAPMSDDWTLAIGLLDAEGHVITSADGDVAGYPTSVWRPGPDFADTRRLIIPRDVPDGNYRLYLGWYRRADGQRLQPVGEGVQSDLYILPAPITICTCTPAFQMVAERVR